MSVLPINPGNWYRSGLIGLTYEVVGDSFERVFYRVWLDGRPIGIGDRTVEEFASMVVNRCEATPAHT